MARILRRTDNHDGEITHLEPDILECEVKWALGSITMNKASAAFSTDMLANSLHPIFLLQLASTYRTDRFLIALN